jgi:hypothetical protein
MPRRDYDDDDDFDDRPHPRTRRRYDDDDDDDYDPRPHRRRRAANSNVAPLIIGLVVGGVVLLGVAGTVGYLAFRAAPKPMPVANAGAPPIVAPMGPNNGAMIPGGPGAPAPIAPLPGMPGAAGIQQVTISNLRVQRGIAGRTELVFDYQFLGGRPIGIFSAVVIGPGGTSGTATIHMHDEQGTISLSQFGPFGGNFQSGTKVYLSNHAIGIGNTPPPISNTLTLP